MLTPVNLIIMSLPSSVYEYDGPSQISNFPLYYGQALPISPLIVYEEAEVAMSAVVLLVPLVSVQRIVNDPERGIEDS